MSSLAYWCSPQEALRLPTGHVHCHILHCLQEWTKETIREGSLWDLSSTSPSPEHPQKPSEPSYGLEVDILADSSEHGANTQRHSGTCTGFLLQSTSEQMNKSGTPTSTPGTGPQCGIKD